MPAAMARPIPEPAPVTTATRSVSRMCEGSIAINYLRYYLASSRLTPAI
jgi:hypothetical protein